MTRWFTSDIHFKHRNIIPYCLRPYDDVNEMNEAIIKQWNSQVKPEDEVWMIGDFSINKKSTLDKRLVSILNGKKHIILGNHDTGFNTLHNNKDCVDTHVKIAKKYLEAGWVFVDIIKYMMLKDGTHVVITHLPPDNGYDSRYSEFKLANNPAFNYVHGHLHGHYRKKRNMVDVCYDAELRLLSEEELIGLVNSKEEFIPTRLTDHYAKTNNHNLLPFEKEVKNKNVKRFVSKDEKLVGYNYTDQCTFDRAWNDVTKNSRGIVFEKDTGRVVAIPFPKFWNYSELMGIQDE